jgi:catechol 2,3-dioxygenase-like lactoylglutathione lyase family enzyme
MKRILAKIVFVAVLSSLAFAADSPARPKITGVDHVAFYTTNAEGVKQLYGVVLGLGSARPIEAGSTMRHLVGSQWVGFSPAPDVNSTNRMDHIAFTTNNLSALQKYLAANGINGSPVRQLKDHQRSFTVTDPEGHKVEFVQKGRKSAPAPPASAVSHRMIHAGFIVNHRDQEDHFYKDVLGFRLYWSGGMKPEQTDWVAMQVPDGTDWLEYMLNQPEHPDLNRTGVMNHISLGVKDMKQAQAMLEAHGWKPHGNEHSQMGRDGKWQLNLYDPDQTRIELMEFKPAEKPCCSEFQGSHPEE